MVERMTHSKPLQAPLTGENPVKGFLLFDRQVGLVKDWVGFRQSPKYQTLEGEARLLTDQASQVNQQVDSRVQQLSQEASSLKNSLEQAKLEARKAASDYNKRSLKAGFYRVASIISPDLAERIIPYKTAQARASALGREIRNVKKETESNKRKAEREQETLEIKRRSMEDRLPEVELERFFHSKERVLLHALTYLSQNQEARNRFFLEYAKRSQANIGEIEKQYADLAQRAAPSLYRNPAEIDTGRSIDLGAKEDQVLADFSKKEKSTKWGQNQQCVADFSGTEEAKPRRRVIIYVGKKKYDLDSISEKELDKLIARSGTPITPDDIKGLIEILSTSSSVLDIHQRYSSRVKTGRFEGWHVFKQGKMGRIPFNYKSEIVNIRLGGYFQVYDDSYR